MKTLGLTGHTNTGHMGEIPVCLTPASSMSPHLTHFL